MYPENMFTDYRDRQLICKLFKLFFADFCSEQILHPFVPHWLYLQIVVPNIFCNKLFLSCGLGQGCPGGPDLQDLNQQIIWKSWDVAPVAAQHGENRAVFCSGKFAKSIISSSKSLGFHVKHSSALNAVWAGLEIQAIYLKNGTLSQQGLPLQDAFVWHLTIRRVCNTLPSLVALTTLAILPSVELIMTVDIASLFTQWRPSVECVNASIAFDKITLRPNTSLWHTQWLEHQAKLSKCLERCYAATWLFWSNMRCKPIVAHHVL